MDLSSPGKSTVRTLPMEGDMSTRNIVTVYYSHIVSGVCRVLERAYSSSFCGHGGVLVVNCGDALDSLSHVIVGPDAELK
jgi:hypothetical protein